MTSIPFVSAADVAAALPMSAAIESMRHAFAALGAGRVEMPVRTPIRTAHGTTFFMPAFLDGNFDESSGGVLAQKIVSVRPANAALGQPVVQALVVVIDVATGAPRALIEGAFLTALRTGAVTGLATDLLADARSKDLLLFGVGGQAEMQVRAVCAVRPIERVRVVSRSHATAQAFVDRVASGDPSRAYEVALDCVADAVRGADVIVTATGATEPLFDGAWPKDGALVNAIGAYRPDMREVDATLLRRAVVVVDQRAAALHEAGDLLIPAANGEWTTDAIAAELSDLVLGRVRVERGRTVVFKSCGLALEDAAAAAAVLRRLGR